MKTNGQAKNGVTRSLVNRRKENGSHVGLRSCAKQSTLMVVLCYHDTCTCSIRTLFCRCVPSMRDNIFEAKRYWQTNKASVFAIGLMLILAVWREMMPSLSG